MMNALNIIVKLFEIEKNIITTPINNRFSGSELDGN